MPPTQAPRTRPGSPASSRALTLPAHRPRQRRAFTLIELIVVVIIIAVLSAIAVLSVNTYVGRARDTAAQASLTGIAKKVSAVALAQDVTPTQAMLDAELPSGWATVAGTTTRTGEVSWKVSVTGGDFSLGLATLGSSRHCVMALARGGATTGWVIGKDAGAACTGENALAGREAAETAANTPPPLTGTVSTLAGSSSGSQDGTGAGAMFATPTSVAVAADGTVYVADTNNHKIRKVTPAGVVTTYAGSGTAGAADGQGTSASFTNPRGLAIGPDGTLYVADYGNHRIRKISPSGMVTTVAGGATSGTADGPAGTARFNNPTGVALAADGSLYVADYRNQKIRKIATDGTVSTVAGSGTGAFADGTGAAASFKWPYGITVGTDGNIYVADTGNNRIRKVTPAGVVTTFVGTGSPAYTDGTGTGAAVADPVALAAAADGSLYLADYTNQRVRKITAAGVVSTVAGTGTAGTADGALGTAQFSNPYGIAVGPDGAVYTADSGSHRIRVIR